MTKCVARRASQKIKLCNAPALHEFFNLFGLIHVFRWAGLSHSGHHNEFWVVFRRAVIFPLKQGLKAGCYWLVGCFFTTDFFCWKTRKQALFLTTKAYCSCATFVLGLKKKCSFKYLSVFGVQSVYNCLWSVAFRTFFVI